MWLSVTAFACGAGTLAFSCTESTPGQPTTELDAGDGGNADSETGISDTPDGGAGDGDALVADATGWDALTKYGDPPAPCGPSTELVEYVYANKACSVDGDCTLVASTCVDLRESCSGAFYLNKQHDPTILQSLLTAATTCPHFAPCCDGLPPPPKCVHGRCMSEAHAGPGLDKCLLATGSAGDCTFCACVAAPCPGDPGCAPIFECARKVGAYGTPAGDLADPNFPCKAVVDSIGGPMSQAADEYRQSNVQAAFLGCGAVCAKPDAN